MTTLTVPGTPATPSPAERPHQVRRLVRLHRPAADAAHTVVESRVTGRQLSALIRPASPLPTDWRTTAPSLEELVLAYLRNPRAASLTPAETEETHA
ncbi:hypothetical protein [Streptomyces sp. NPDC001435]|uniref:hypothetical protein n=1 Tax=Streptomyces sp. NPDC001435 TaxID=3364576 RepID=UPI00369C0511